MSMLVAADGTTILAAAYSTTPLLPHPRMVDRSNVQGWPDDEGDEPKSAMVAFRVPPEVGKHYMVEADEGVHPVALDDRHITILISDKDLPGPERRRLHEATRHWLADGEWDSLEGRPQGWGTFNTPEKDEAVLWMSWDIPGLNEMRQDLKENLEGQGFAFKADHDYTPHETVAYIDGGIGGIPSFPQEPIDKTFNAVVVADGKNWTEYDFPLAMALRHSASMSIVAALEAARDPELEALSDQELDALIAAGGLDRNRGNAERLRRYWTVGPGGAKIKWNTPGDWKRCYAHLSKYLGPRAKGYCQLRHKEMTKLYTGDMKHRILYGWGGLPGSYWAKVAAKSAASNEENHTLVTMTAGGDGMGDDEIQLDEGVQLDETNPLVMLLNGGQPMAPPQPVGFHIPMLLPEGVESGDGRTFDEGVIETRELPIPLLWQPNSMQGHDGSGIVGRIDHMERIDGGMGNVNGVFDSSPMAQEAIRLIREGFLRGVSADLDKFEGKVMGKGPGTAEAKEKGKKDDDDIIAADKMKITKGRIMAATLVAKPAFEEARIELLEPEQEAVEDGDYQGVPLPDIQELAVAFARMVREGNLLTLSNGTTMSLVASAAPPVDPPAKWFENPGLTKPTHLTITDDGQVFGHIAAWQVDHIGMSFGTRPPRSKTNYAYFRTGLLRTAEGEDIRVGQITLAGGHASLNADAREAVRHYDDTQSAFADVVAGEDQYGIWVAGALRPEVTATQVRAARASSPSGDWRPIGGRLELVAICQVNVPGFPVVEARVASGQVVALVAAGAAPLTMDFLQENSELSVLAAQARATMMAPLQKLALSAQDRMMAPMQQQAMVASAKMAKARMSSARTLRNWTLEDGTFRVSTADDITAGFAAYERADDASKPAIRRHLAACAVELDCYDRVPYAWLTTALIDDGIAEFRDFPTKKRKELSKSGAALPDGSYPVVTVADLKNAVHAYGRSKKSDRAKVRKHIMKRAKAIGHADLIPDTWKSMAIESMVAAVDSGHLPKSEMSMVITAAATFGMVDALPLEWDAQTAEAIGIDEALVASLRQIRRKSWDEARVSRDDIGRFRKIYYRLRRGGAAEKPKVRAALRAIKEAERTADQEGTTDRDSAVLARDLLTEVAMEGGVDERTSSELVESAQEMSDLVRRFEVRGEDTMMDFDQLPTEIQNAISDYLRSDTNLEGRISEHFSPFEEGKTKRSVKDILNLLDRVIVDAQKYHEGYDSVRL